MIPTLAAPSFKTSRLFFRRIDGKLSLEEFKAVVASSAGTMMNGNAWFQTPISSEWETLLERLSSSAVRGSFIAYSIEEERPIGILAMGDVSDAYSSGEFGIAVKAERQGMGYGTEMLEWWLHYAFSFYGLHKIEGKVFGWNFAAMNLYRRMGFVTEVTKRHHHLFRGKWYDEYQIGLLKEEWKRIQRKGLEN